MIGSKEWHYPALRSRIVLLIVGFVLVLAGCGGDKSPSAIPGTSSQVRALKADRGQPPGQDRIDEGMAECLTDKGWPATVDDDDGGVLWASRDEQQEEAHKAWESCTVQLFELGIMNKPEKATEVSMSDHYDKLLLVKKCLEGEGWEIKSMSRREYISIGGEWTPDFSVPLDLAKPKRDELERKCPQP